MEGARVTARSKALFIGGRAGVGKSSVGYEIHAQLSAACVQHCLIEGDNLDLAWPTPHENGVALANRISPRCGPTIAPTATGG
jgi:hypothetical protein